MSIHLAEMARQPAWEQYQMSDEQTKAPEVDENTQQDPAREPDWKAFSRKWEDRAKAANAELEELRKRASKLDEIEEAQKTAEQKQADELEKLRADLAEARNSVAAKDRAILVERVAASKGVPARYLTGETEDDLTASAEQFLEDAKTVAPAKQVGYVGSQGTGDPTPPATSLDDVRERAKRFARK